MAAWVDDQHPYPPDVLARFEPNTTTDECFMCRPSRTKKNGLLERCRWTLDETAEFPVCDKHTSAEAYRRAQSLIYSKRYKRESEADRVRIEATLAARRAIASLASPTVVTVPRCYICHNWRLFTLKPENLQRDWKATESCDQNHDSEDFWQVYSDIGTIIQDDAELAERTRKGVDEANLLRDVWYIAAVIDTPPSTDDEDEYEDEDDEMYDAMYHEMYGEMYDEISDEISDQISDEADDEADNEADEEEDDQEEHEDDNEGNAEEDNEEAVWKMMGKRSVWRELTFSYGRKTSSAVL